MKHKFRAWHTHKQIMCEVIRIDFEQEIVTLDLETDDDEYFWIETDWSFSDVKIMQSTGLKDSDGVDIFEGDIVEYFHTPAVIQKVKGGFAIVNTKSYEYTTDLNGHMRILGNIYENPELLEVVE